VIDLHSYETQCLTGSYSRAAVSIIFPKIRTLILLEICPRNRRPSKDSKEIFARPEVFLYIMEILSIFSLLGQIYPQLLWILLGGIFSYSTVYMLYNLYFHPLAGFPGPWWAAVSHAHEFYFDVVLHGLYFKQIEKMHEKYGTLYLFIIYKSSFPNLRFNARIGPIIRINPREIHINDPHFYNQIYINTLQKRNKDPKHVTFGSVPLSMVSTIDHDHHRFRRSILSNFFSRQSVLRLESLIESKVDKVVQRFREISDEGKTIDIHYAFIAFASDVVSHYAYGEAFGNLEDPEFNGTVHKSIAGIMNTTHVARFFPFLFPLLQRMPLAIAKRLNTGLGAILEYRRYMNEFASKVLESNNASSKGGFQEKIGRGTVFEALASPDIPEEERTPERIEDEAWLVSVAASETVARTLTVLAYFVFHGDRERRVLKKLRDELRGVMQTVDIEPTLGQLETLPYLVSMNVLYKIVAYMTFKTAVIKEALRMSFGPVSRLPRISPIDPVVYGEWVIPPGVSSFTISTVPFFYYATHLLLESNELQRLPTELKSHNVSPTSSF